MGDQGEEKEGRGELALYTVGHSNRSAEEFAGLLRGDGAGVLADVRRLPGSNKYPHFNRDELSASLAGAGILYVYLGVGEAGRKRRGRVGEVRREPLRARRLTEELRWPSSASKQCLQHNRPGSSPGRRLLPGFGERVETAEGLTSPGVLFAEARYELL
ncbi:MAG TPA: DUF488 domain-containing protein, partial [Pyrinomonadaceae bacterium]